MYSYPSTGGTQWSQMTPTYSGLTSIAHEANTLIDITGGGVMSGVWTENALSATVAVQVDGEATYYATTQLDADSPFQWFLLPFKYSLKVTASAATARVNYHLD